MARIFFHGSCRLEKGLNAKGARRRALSSSAAEAGRKHSKCW
jgi:hypothetical protein